jgi:DNA-binding IclR family transcriptional regulator
MGRTKDELFVLRLYTEAQEMGNVEGRLNKYEVGQKSGLHPKAVDAICRLLVQANFIKKAEEDKIYLTPHGLLLAERLIGED